jgi:hypothetical protein
MVTEEDELAKMEDHLLQCSSCVERAENAQDYVDLVRVSIIAAGLDLE